MEPLTDPRLRAKRQLAEAMHDLPDRRGRWGRWLLAAGMAASFIGAGIAAWFTMRPQLLTPPQRSEKSSIPHQDTEWRQWFHASRIGTEEAWKSVIDYPGVSELVALRAKQHLARVYLREEKYDRAIAVCDALASTSDNNAEFKAFGLAGKCGALSLQGNYQESSDVLNQFWPYKESLRDSQMTKLLRRAAEKNRDNLGPPTSLQWDDWLNQHFGPGG
jgi:hypothetical protein